MKRFVLMLLSVLCLSCDRERTDTVSNGMSLFAFVVADNDLDDHADYIENDMLNGLKGCPAGTELFLYEDRKDKSPTLRQFILTKSGQVVTV